MKRIMLIVLLYLLAVTAASQAATYTTVQLRRDTAANWAAYNPVLAAGEVGCEMSGTPARCTAQKIGDGVTTWTSLPYAHDPEFIAYKAIERPTLGANTFTGVQTVAGLVTRSPELNVKHPAFGAYNDGTHAAETTEAIRTACISGAKRVYLPAGTYLINPVISTAPNTAGIYVPDGVELYGDGRSTVIKFNMTGVTNSGYHGIRYGNGAYLHDFELDGNKAAAPGGLTSVQFYGIHNGGNDLTGFEIARLWIHDVLGVNQESFGLGGSNGGTNFKIHDIEGWNVDGTPVSINGDYPSGKVMSNGSVWNIIAHGNTWMGVTLYGTDNVRLRSIHAYDNARRGLNVEWSSNVDIRGLDSHNNGTGFGTYGWNRGVRLYDSHIYSNDNTTYPDGAELKFMRGAWHTGSPIGITQDVELNNCKIEPPPGHLHLYMHNAADATVGEGIIQSITINTPGAETWRVGSAIANYITPSMTYPAAIVRPMAVESFIHMDKSPALSLSNFGGTGNVSSSAQSISATAQFNALYSKYILKAGKQYLVKLRWQPLEQKNWVIYAADAADDPADRFGFRLADNGTTYIQRSGEWYEAAFVTPRAATDKRVVIRNFYDGANTLNLDYLDVSEIVSGNNSQDYGQGGNQIRFLPTRPTTGSWTAGDVVYNTAPAVVGVGGYATSNQEYTVLGWRRITTSANNNIGTDWVEMRVLTGQ